MADGQPFKPQQLASRQRDSTTETQESVVSIAISYDCDQRFTQSESTIDVETRPQEVSGEQVADVETKTFEFPRHSATKRPAGGYQIPVSIFSCNESLDHSKNVNRVHEIPLTDTREKLQAPAPQAQSLKGSLVRLKRTSIPILLCFVSFGLLATVTTYVQSSYSAESKSRRGLPLSDLLKTDVSKTLTVLRTSQGILSALTSLALDNVFFLLQWSQIHPPNGLSYLRILALSPTTGGLGTLRLLQSSAPNLTTKLWAILRVTMTAMVWFSGLALFFNTSMVTVYDTAHTYDVIAGVGTFNGSFVQPFKDFLRTLSPGHEYETLPYSYFAGAYTLVVNPLVSAVAETRGCSDNLCASYILSGGLETVIPWAPQGYDDHSMVMVKNVTSIQADFTGLAVDEFDDGDCVLFGESRAMTGRLCLAQAPSDPGTIRAGVFVCPSGIDNGTCEGHDSRPNITTQVSFSTLQTSIVAARSNHSIISVMDSTEPIPVQDLDLAAYRGSLRWLLNYTAADLPPPSTIAQSFSGAKTPLQDPATWGIQFQHFQSILVFPFWLFNANNWGNPETRANTTVPNLPPEFFTQASIVEPYAKIKFQPAMFALFLVLQVLSLLFICGVVFWAWVRSRVPLKTSSFPIFDIAFRAEVQNGVEDKELNQLDDSEIVHLMKDAKVLGRVEEC